MKSEIAWGAIAALTCFSIEMYLENRALYKQIDKAKIATGLLKDDIKFCVDRMELKDIKDLQEYMKDHVVFFEQVTEDL